MPKMTAVEKLQMLIEAAEYLDRRERGKVTVYEIYISSVNIKLCSGLQINPDTVARVLVCCKAKNRGFDLFIRGECMICRCVFFILFFFPRCYDIW